MQVLIMFKFLNSFNPEIQLKDTASAIKNKLIDLLPDLSWFKRVQILNNTSFRIQRNRK